MPHYGRFVLRSAVAGLLVLSMGCMYRVQLRTPRTDDSVEVGGEASPQFSWRSSYIINRPGDYYEYSLTVSRDPAFNSVVFQKDKIDTHKYVIDPEEAWLDGDETYYWKVEGVVRDADSEERKKLPCEKPRSFKLAKRRTVQVAMTVPEGFEARIGGDDESFVTGILPVTLEHGARRMVTLRAQDGSLEVSGQLKVLAANDNTDYGRITINNLEAEKLKLIANGDVGDYSYELGGEKIVEMKLGGKTSNDS